ncbi:pyrroloquinoline quinone biosynthesis peptide chaperone PqqD [Roseococcus suduntuyensis]|uniref:Pyrroloquinoline quinone biosynthesis protein D n=1 Tax=Roseococcus suduntuyensis TaxID=455361 RepID=A0A840AFX7_9PROT|nr:pyrroloquinoline quinone biosynthesis peptide chaperone PqqD [Roseococcus suduntuyensis]MBB3899802.1 pyrroloquinoline quinone biosynthesis protein D [Roseococcus suduntuyensis]
MTIPRFAPGVRLQEDRARNRWMVMAPERMFLPDETALAVLRLVDGARDEAAIVAALAEEYAAPADIIAADVRALLEDLRVRGAITW